MAGLLLALAAAAAASAAAVPLPTQQQLAWHDDEIGVLIHFNMQTYMGNPAGNLCGEKSPIDVPPPPSLFSPTQLDTDAWIQAARSMGAKYAVLTAKHCTGFCIYPTKVAFPFLPGPGGSYNYSVAEAAVKTDVVGAFVKSCQTNGVKPGIYYSLGSNAYTLGQLNLTRHQHDQVVLAQTKELFSNYGDLHEIWFDGGYVPDYATVPAKNLTEQLSNLQPDAVVFNGFGVARSPIRWSLSEDGSIEYPNWDTMPPDPSYYGSGLPNGTAYCPAECDTTLQSGDTWFWEKGAKLRDLAELRRVYISTVGNGANLLMDIAPNPAGGIDAGTAARMKEFGDWISSCYGEQAELAHTGPIEGSTATLDFGKNATVNRLVLQEDLSKGQLIRNYSVEFRVAGQWTNEGLVPSANGTSVGHKRIHQLKTGFTSDAVRVTFSSVNGVGYLRRFAAFVSSPACLYNEPL